MKKIIALLIWVFILTNSVQAEDFPRLDEAIPGEFVSELAPVFDFDTDGCLPSAGISREGEQNEGLELVGDIAAGCRDDDFLETSNTLHRYACTSKIGATYCGHFYALYFEKDACDVLFCGHKHDWEYAVIWTTDGVITHGSCSAHGELNTRVFSDLPLDENGHMKIVYHQDGLLTHALRFAGADEVAENPYGEFVTPAIISWDSLPEDIRDNLNNFDYGSAILPMKDSNFLVNLNRDKPSGYPEFFPQLQEDCVVTDSVSEEQVSVTCPTDYAVTGVKCWGSYCDNKQLQCCRIPGLTLEGPEVSSQSFSDEHGPYINNDMAVVGMNCAGRYCDNVSLIMRTAISGTGGEWTESFSEEHGPGICGSGYVAGADCTGDYCDSLKLYCREAILFDTDNDGLLDIEELIFGTDPLVADSDEDGLTDGEEVNNYDTDPLNPDTDGDGIPDGLDAKPLIPVASNHDMDNDRDSDIVLRNSQHGGWRIFTIQDMARVSETALGIWANQALQLQAIADFDGDGDADVLLRNTTPGTGGWRLFTIEDGAVVNDTSASILPSLTRTFQAAADFDGDGDADVLLRDTTSGSYRVYFFEDGVVVSDATLGLYSNLALAFAGAGDLDGDGDADVLVRHTTAGSWRAFYLENGVVDSTQTFDAWSDTTWTYQGLADYDKDGDADLLLRDNNGYWQLFEVQDGQVTSTNPVNAWSNTLWATQSAQHDLDGDSDADILLRNSDTGAWRTFTMENRDVITNGNPLIWSNKDWVLQ